MCAKSYQNRSRFDKVIRKITWCSFMPHMLDDDDYDDDDDGCGFV